MTAQTFTDFGAVLVAQFATTQPFALLLLPLFSAWWHLATSASFSNRRSMFGAQLPASRFLSNLGTRFRRYRMSLTALRHLGQCIRPMLTPGHWCACLRTQVISLLRVADEQAIHPVLLTLKQLRWFNFLDQSEGKGCFTVLLPGSLEVAVAVIPSSQVRAMDIPAPGDIHRASDIDVQRLDVCDAVNAGCHTRNYSTSLLRRPPESNQLTETTWEHVGWGSRWRDQGL